MEKSLKSDSFLEELSCLVCVVRFELESGAFEWSSAFGWRSLEFSWVPSTTLTSALGLPLLRSGSSMGTSPTHVIVGRAARPIAGATPWSTHSLQRAGTHVNCDPQLVSPSLAAGIFQ